MSVAMFFLVAFSGYVLGVGTVMLLMDFFVIKEFPSRRSVLLGLLGIGLITVACKVASA